MQIIQQGCFNAYPGALVEAIISIGTTSILSGLWYQFMNRKTQ